MRMASCMTAIASCAVAASAYAADINPRACKPSDLSGLWQNVGMTETPPGDLTEMFKRAPYEYFIFDGHGRFVYEARAAAGPMLKESNLTPEEQEQQTDFIKEIAVSSGKAGKFDAKVEHGTLTLSRNDAPWATFNCVVAQQDAPDEPIKRGDMVWYTLPGVTPSLKRVERQLTRPL